LAKAQERAEMATFARRAQSIVGLTQDLDAKAADLLRIITHAAAKPKGTAQSVSAAAEQTTHLALDARPGRQVRPHPSGSQRHHRSRPRRRSRQGEVSKFLTGVRTA
jgi:hypothetical protein